MQQQAQERTLRPVWPIRPWAVHPLLTSLAHRYLVCLLARFGAAIEAVWRQEEST
jgi:hypothetical protein